MKEFTVYRLPFGRREFAHDIFLEILFWEGKRALGLERWNEFSVRLCVQYPWGFVETSRRLHRSAQACVLATLPAKRHCYTLIGWVLRPKERLPCVFNLRQ